MKAWRIAALAFAVLCAASLFTSAASAATTAEVLDKVAKQEAGMKTFEADVHVDQFTGTLRTESTGHTVTQTTAREGHPVVHLMSVRSAVTMSDGKKMNTLIVDDGEFLWSETRELSTGRIIVVKTASSEGAPEASDETRRFRDLFKLELVREDTVDGRKVWVLEGPIKPEQRSRAPLFGAPRSEDGIVPPEKMRLFVDESDFVVRRMLLFVANDKVLMDQQYTNVKVNAPVDPALFTYTPPPGARVVDLTRTPAPSTKEAPNK